MTIRTARLNNIFDETSINSDPNDPGYVVIPDDTVIEFSNLLLLTQTAITGAYKRRTRYNFRPWCSK